MMKPTKAQAKAYLQEALDEIPVMRELTHRSTQFITWRRNTQVSINNIFGENSGNAQEFSTIRHSSRVADQEHHRRAYRSGLNRASAILKSMITEIDRWWTNDAQTSLKTDLPNTNEASISERVFVVHGRDEATTHTVARYIEGLGLEVVILREQPNEGRTIIEKFEEYAETVGFAVILGTPDDVGSLADEPDNLRPRMRQNVVFELGYFTRALGRKRVCVLLKGDVERPSDYDGVIYIPLDDSEGWKLRLATELKAGGLPVDMNRLVDGSGR